MRPYRDNNNNLIYYSHMLKRLSFTLLTFLTTAALLLSVPAQAAAQSQEWGGVCVEEGDVATIQGLECLIANIFAVIITLIGFVGFVMFIIGSFRWMLSGGNSKGVETARNTMTYAVVGLVVALSAFVILNLIAEFTGVGVITEFSIPTSN